MPNTNDWDLDSGGAGQPVPRNQKRAVLSVSLTGYEFQALSKWAEAHDMKVSQAAKMAISSLTNPNWHAAETTKPIGNIQLHAITIG